MALTVKEQLDILNGVEAPTSYTFNQYIEQVAINFCQDFLTTTKIFDNAVEIAASRYLSRMTNICSTVARENGIYNTQMAKSLIAIFADTGTIAQVQAADDNAWVVFIENNMLETIENLAGVNAEEKSEYDGIV